MCIHAQLCVGAHTYTCTHVSWPENKQSEKESLPPRTVLKVPQAFLTLFPDLLDCWPPQFRRDGGFGMNPEATKWFL